MKWRDPEERLHKLPKDVGRQAPPGRWTDHAATLMTPMMGGGTEAGVPDQKMPVRASAIRGQLRWWWRLLASQSTGMSIPSPELFQKEREIWGSMAEQDKDLASKVRIRIKDVSNCSLDACNNRTGPIYALFPAREQRGREPREARDLVRPGMTFTLSVFVQKEDGDNLTTEVDRALRWWLTFGGLGARTRRGCGSLFCPDLTPVDEQEAKAAGCRLVLFNKGRNGHAVGNSDQDRIDAWNKAWREAIHCLSDFRQGPGLGRNGSDNDPGRSCWPEADSIRELTGTHAKAHPPVHPARIAFPRAVFGLPIVFKFKDDRNGDPWQTELVPCKAERMASPLILTPYLRQKGSSMTCVAAALLLPQRLLDHMPLSLDDPIPQEWWTPDKASLVAPIRDFGGADAMDSFLNFFAQGGERP